MGAAGQEERGALAWGKEGEEEASSTRPLEAPPYPQKVLDHLYSMGPRQEMSSRGKGTDSGL